jgi:hypothetical protein
VADPFVVPPAEAVVHHTDALLLIREGRIAGFGPADRLLRELPPGTPVDRFPGGLMVPGFIDCHVHFAQLGIIGGCEWGRLRGLRCGPFFLPLQLAALAFETRVIAAPEGELGLIEMQDMVGHLVQEIAVMADDQDRRGIMGEIVDQPERAFEIEIVGGLVEQQNVRRRKEHGGEGHAHAPAPRKFREGAPLSLMIKAEA